MLERRRLTEENLGQSLELSQYAFQYQILVDNPKIQQEMVPYFMARIVDVGGFLKQYPFAHQPEPVTIQVEDDFAEWNKGVYKIEDGTAARVEETNPDFQCDIRTLTALLLGVHSLEFF
ncbi:sterol carrier protein domain-containing protein [Aneurinibacillus tyrosinisolvens]|uniref:sterol carrier protein domain-containing protein n=1 Tax=Aneurinibacillus tyrosinisolvens TaxID=1443435 RepID=UPI00063F26A6|nr:sterol carrier protein domain-containing protein [Aneurinibacillus tyrosinisolvens]